MRKLQKLKLYHNGARQANRFDNPSKGKVEEFEKLSYEDVKKKIFSIRQILSAYAAFYRARRIFCADCGSGYLRNDCSKYSLKKLSLKKKWTFITLDEKNAKFAFC